MIPSHVLNSLLPSLRAGKASNSFFDQIYPDEMRKVSTTHWTPLDVVSTALQFFTNSPKLRFLDVGSGCGKFCHAGAMLYPQFHFTGVERRDELVNLSKQIADEFHLSNIEFICSDAFDLNWDDFDVLYFYNPFWENHLDAKIRIDKKTPVKKEDFDYYIKETLARLNKLQTEKYIITYHGFGGKLPASFECFERKTCGTDQIEIWKKMSR